LDVERAVLDDDLRGSDRTRSRREAAHGACSSARCARFSRRRGQNQAVSAMPTGTAPQTIAQGVKIEPTKSTVVATAPANGQIVGSGNDSRVSGLASRTL